MTVTIRPGRCPDTAVLGDFLLGKRGAAELEQIARHLGTCSVCLAKARILESQTDALVDSLRGELAEDGHAQEPACREGSIAVAGQQFSSARTDPSNASAGQSIGRLGTYELLEEIGRGGTGVVYRAEHTRLKSIVAVKVLPTEALMRPDALARFDREMVAIGQLVHPHIVQATDAGEDEGRHFLVMEYVERGDFATLVDRQGPLPVAEATTCILQAARGLAAAHAKGLIHRDVKPSNLLLSADGLVKVSDLGLAKALLSGEGEGSTYTGSLMGTFDFMAPEQALNAKGADECADVYGLGCTLYFLLTGSPPFVSDSAFETLIAHREQPPPSVREVRPEVPRSLDRLMQRMMAKLPRDRPQTMAQIAQELAEVRLKIPGNSNEQLSRLLAGERREVVLRPRRKAGRRLRAMSRVWIAAIAGVVLGALLVGVGSLWWFGTTRALAPAGASAARFDVRLVKAAEGVSIQHVSEAVRLLHGGLPSSRVVSGRFRYLDFIDPLASTGGYFDTDLAFPGFEVANDIGDTNYFAILAKATVDFPRPGAWTFCVVSDDGFQLSVDGKIVGEHGATRTQAATLITLELTEAGPHLVELVYFEGTGGADLELCVAEGRYDDFDAEAFRLVGDSYDGGLSLLRPE